MLPQTPASTPGFEEKMQVSLSHPVHIQNLKESQFQLLVSFHLLSLKLSNQVSNEASTLIYHSTTSCQAFLAEKDHFCLWYQEVQAQLHVYSGYEWFCLLQDGCWKNFICISALASGEKPSTFNMLASMGSKDFLYCQENRCIQLHIQRFSQKLSLNAWYT